MTDTQRKAPTGLIIGGGIFLILVIGIFVVIGAYANAVAFGAQSERQIEATWENNKNILGQYTTKVNEVIQLPQMQQQALSQVLRDAFGQNGRSGNQAAMQWIKEAYPGTLDNSMYNRILTIIDAGRTDFQENQKTLIDQKRVYQTNLDYVFKGGMLRLAGYPKADLSKYNVVISSQAAKAFETGIDDGVKFAPTPAQQPQQ